jgi:hypothetical protein
MTDPIRKLLAAASKPGDRVAARQLWGRLPLRP